MNTDKKYKYPQTTVYVRKSTREKLDQLAGGEQRDRATMIDVIVDDYICENDLSLCRGCWCMTRTTSIGNCGKCKAAKMTR